MANSFQGLNAAAGILKNWYSGPIISQFNDAIPFYKAIEKGREKAGGLQVVVPLKVRRNQGIGATSDGGSLPSIGKQTTVQAIVPYIYNYLRFGITGPMVKASQQDRGAFVTVMENEMTEGLNDFKSDFNRQLQSDGTGTLAVLAANASSTNVITVNGRESTENVKYLDVGSVIDIVSSGTVVASGVGITAVSGLNTLTATLTLDTNVTCTKADIVVKSGAYNIELSGILYTMDGGTGTIYSVDRSIYIAYQGNVVDNSASQLTLDVMQKAFNLGRELGDAHYDGCWVDYTTERMINKLLVADKRFVGKIPGDGSFSDKDSTYLEFGGIPVIADKDAYQRVAFLDGSTFKKYELCALEWADESGSYMIPQTGADQWEIRLRHLANVFCNKPRGNAVVKNYVSP